MKIPLNLKKSGLITALTFSITLSNVHAYRVMASLNTYKKAKVTNAVNRVTELKADGLWVIMNNSDLNNNEWRHIVNLMGGWRVTEDNPNSNYTYQRFRNIMGYKPNDVFCYNETGGAAGGTLLSNAQINTQSSTHGGDKLICLTRAYVPGAWKNNVDRCLNNSKVEGICWEPVKAAIMELTPGIHNGGPQLIQAVANAGKKLYVLIHGSANDGWSDSDNLHIINKLRSWSPPGFFNGDNLTIVYQNYDQTPNNINTTHEWYGASNSVKSAINQAKAQPGYRGSGGGGGGGGGGNYKSLRKRNAIGFAIDGGNGGSDGQNVYLWSYASNNGNQQWQEINRGGGFYTYKKKNTNFVIDGNNGGSNDQNVYLWSESPGNQNQHWKKVHMGGSFFRLEKRNAGGFSIDGGGGGSNNQNVKLWGSSNTNQNQHWQIQ